VLALNGMRAISDPKRDPSPTPPSQQHQFQVRATTLPRQKIETTLG
jgi:hypothetical protein